MLMKNNDDIVGVTVNHGRSVLLTWPNGTPLRAGEKGRAVGQIGRAHV